MFLLLYCSSFHNFQTFIAITVRSQSTATFSRPSSLFHCFRFSPPYEVYTHFMFFESSCTTWIDFYEKKRWNKYVATATNSEPNFHFSFVCVEGEKLMWSLEAVWNFRETKFSRWDRKQRLAEENFGIVKFKNLRHYRFLYNVQCSNRRLAITNCGESNQTCNGDYRIIYLLVMIVFGIRNVIIWQMSKLRLDVYERVPLVALNEIKIKFLCGFIAELYKKKINFAHFQRSFWI